MACGVFLALWYRTVFWLPARRRPSFANLGLVRWGIPTISIVFTASGIVVLYRASVALLITITMVIILLAFLILKFDRYTATATELYDVYRKIRLANPSMEELEVLYHMAEHRYPRWPQDRILELVAGKDIENLILVTLVQENDINPLADWELYRFLKKKVSRVVNPK